MEAEDSDAENLQSAEELHLNAHRALVLWARGSLAEQQGEYAAAKAFFTDRLDAGNVVWVKKALPTLGWALLGLGELAEAQAYFQQVCDDANRDTSTPLNWMPKSG